MLSSALGVQLDADTSENGDRQRAGSRSESTQARPRSYAASDRMQHPIVPMAQRHDVGCQTASEGDWEALDEREDGHVSKRVCLRLLPAEWTPAPSYSSGSEEVKSGTGTVSAATGQKKVRRSLNKLARILEMNVRE